MILNAFSYVKLSSKEFMWLYVYITKAIKEVICNFLSQTSEISKGKVKF